MNGIDALTAMTGMQPGKAKPTHRGARSRGKGKKPDHHAKAQHHAAEITKAMESGDHTKAKLSGLALVNALHAVAKKDAAPVVTPQDMADLPNAAMPLTTPLEAV